MTSFDLDARSAESAFDSLGENSFADGSFGGVSMAEASRSDGPLADIPPSYPDGETAPSMFTGLNQSLVNSIAQYPVVYVGMAVATGVVLGWFIKRR